MGEVTLPCFFISLPKAIFEIARLVGPFREKNGDRGLFTQLLIGLRAVYRTDLFRTNLCYLHLVQQLSSPKLFFRCEMSCKV